jgi:hypothetical protein
VPRHLQPHTSRRPVTRRTRRSIAISVAVLLGAAVLPPVAVHRPALAQSDRCEDVFAPVQPTGAGTEAAPYLIASPAHLTWISVSQFNRDVIGPNGEPVGDPTGEHVRSASYRMTADVDLRSCDWRPLGVFARNNQVDIYTNTSDPTFTGYFDGRGFAIRGLRVSSSPSVIARAPFTDVRQERHRGLFGDLSGTVEHLRLVDVDVTGGANDDLAGGVAGFARGQAFISRVAVSGTVTGRSYVGGLVGIASGSAKVEYSRSSAVIVVDDREESYDFPGFFVTGAGLVGGSFGDGISDSYFTGSVGYLGQRQADLIGLGGVVGEGDAAIIRSYAAGAVAEGTTSGGLLGDGYATDISGFVLSSFWDREATGQARATKDPASTTDGGLTTVAMKSFATFGPDGAVWPIVDGAALFDPSEDQVWGSCATVNGGYPFLLWEIDAEVCPPPPGVTSTPSFLVSVDGTTPSLPAGAAVWQRSDGTTVPLAVSSPAPGQVRYEADGVRLTLTGAAGTSTTRGLIANAAGEVECEICAVLASGGVIEAWMFSEPRLVAAWRIEELSCQTFTIPVGSPLDGGGAVVGGAHTLQLALPTASGMQAVNVGVTVGGPVPGSVPAGDAPTFPTGPLVLMLGLLAVRVLVVRRVPEGAVSG